MQTPQIYTSVKNSNQIAKSKKNVFREKDKFLVVLSTVANPLLVFEVVFTSCSVS